MGKSEIHEIMRCILPAGLMLYALHALFRLTGAEQLVLGIESFAAGTISGASFTSVHSGGFLSADGLFMITAACSGRRMFGICLLTALTARVLKKTGIRRPGADGWLLNPAGCITRDRRPGHRRPFGTAAFAAWIFTVSFCLTIFRITVLLKLHFLFVPGNGVSLWHAVSSMVFTICGVLLVLLTIRKEGT